MPVMVSHLTAGRSLTSRLTLVIGFYLVLCFKQENIPVGPLLILHYTHIVKSDPQ